MQIVNVITHMHKLRGGCRGHGGRASLARRRWVWHRWIEIQNGEAGRNMAINNKDAWAEALTRDQAKLAAALLMISERAAPDITHLMRSTDHGALLYDELGLPKRD